MRTALLSIVLLGLLTGCERPSSPHQKTPADTTHSAATEDGGGLRIAVIPKGTTHDFWKSVHAGAIKAAREVGDAEVIFRGPEREDDREQEIALVQNFISSGVDAIVVAPLDAQALLAPVRQATAAGIPVIIIDSALAGEVGKDFVSFVATDNYRGGQLAGQRLGEVLGDKGRVLLLRYQEGSASTTKREQGFLAALREHHGDIERLDPKRYAGATRDTAQQAAENLLLVHSDVDGIFCPNESSTFGMLNALRSAGLAGKIKFVGFDASPPLVDAVRKGDLAGLVVQNPFKMGYLGVKTAVAHLRGDEVEQRIDTGVALITPENIDEPQYQELLNPDLATYLGP